MVGFLLLALVLITAGAWVALKECPQVLTEGGERIAILTVVTGFLGILVVGGVAMWASPQSTSVASSMTSSATSATSAPEGASESNDFQADAAPSASGNADSRSRGANATVDADTPARSTYYKNCAAVRDAGVAPLTRDDPGYRGKLDRDDDGLACE